jgi:cysteine-rich repeat protein
MNSGSRSLPFALKLTLSVILTPCPSEAQIAGLVSQVSQANIQSHIAALEGERDTTAQQAAAAGYIRAQLESYGYTVASDPVGESENLIATLTGSLTPGQVYVVGAHFDTVAGSPGADDNASAVAGMLEIARVLAGAQTGSTVQFVAFALEEDGLLGSMQFAQAANAAGTDVAGMIALEMIGYTCTTPGCQIAFFNVPACVTVSTEGLAVGTFIGAVANSASAGMIGEFETASSTYVPTLQAEWLEVAGIGTCFSDARRSDHAPFWDVGYPAIMVTDSADFRNPNYHAATDTLLTLDLSFATEVTRATLAMVAASAVVVSPSVCGNGVVEGLEGCDDGNTVDGDCCAADCTFEASGSFCDDDLFCTTGETCDGAGNCGGAAPDTCNDGVGCTADVCEEASEQCTNTPDDAACDDGLFCNGTETCDPFLDCQAGTVVDCDDKDLCTDDSCNETTDQCDNILDPTNDPSCAVCGNGVVEGLEECDDGNVADGDCCSSTCQYEPSGSACVDEGNVCTTDICDGAGACTHLVSREPCVMEGKMCGVTSLIAGCRASPVVAAVVLDPEGDAGDVQGTVTLNGAPAGRLKLKAAPGAPLVCGLFPQGQVFVGELRLKAQGAGALQIRLVATDKAKNVSPPYVLPPYDIVPNKAPSVGEVTLSGDNFPVGEKGELRVTAEVDDDCGVRRASVEVDFGNGRGFLRVGSLSDSGRKGDALAGDGIWSGLAKMQCRSAGTYGVRVAVEDTHREVAYSAESQLTCQ